jgi:predicted NUDIX family NTP pyrophosphohydrolase
VTNGLFLKCSFKTCWYVAGGLSTVTWKDRQLTDLSFTTRLSQGEIMGKKSAGILLYRFNNKQLEVLLVHPGGPFWAKKDLGAWSIPKGEVEDEEAVDVAKREFFEETGVPIEGELIPLTAQKQKGGKTIYAWAVEGNLDASTIKSNLFELEWPPKSGKKQWFPEVDKAEWFSLQAATQKINPGQVALIDELIEKLGLEKQNDASD